MNLLVIAFCVFAVVVALQALTGPPTVARCWGHTITEAAALADGRLRLPPECATAPKSPDP